MLYGAKYKIARRLGERVFSKCESPKYTRALARKKLPDRRGSAFATEFASQLREKQKARYTYYLREKQFGNYVRKAHETGGTQALPKLFTALEYRLDNVVYRMGLTNSRAMARQLVSHGHILVNGRKVTIPSYEVRIKDEVEVRGASQGKGPFRKLDEKMDTYKAPAWIRALSITKAEIVSRPTAADMPPTLDFKAIMEFYSR